MKRIYESAMTTVAVRVPREVAETLRGRGNEMRGVLTWLATRLRRGATKEAIANIIEERSNAN